MSQMSNTMKVSNKLVIKKLKGTPVLIEEEINKELLKLQHGIKSIQNSLPLQTSAEELYRCVENICTCNYDKYLYENLYNLTEDHLKSVLTPTIIRQIDFLGAVNYAWVTFCRQGNFLKNIFLYLDRTFVLENPNFASIWDMQLNLFKKNVALSRDVQTNVVDGLLYLIEKERRGTNVDKNLLKSLIHMLDTLNIYTLIFEVKFLRATSRLYKSEGESLVHQLNVIKYLRHVNDRCNEEKQRIKYYLYPQSEQKVIDILANQLLKRQLRVILETGLAGLMKNDSKEELSLLYDLLRLVKNGRKELCSAFIAYLKQCGGIIAEKHEDNKYMFQIFLEFKDRIDAIVKDCFNDNVEFLEGVKEAFKFSTNHEQNKSAELLTKYTDYILCHEDLKDEEIEVVLNKIMVFFRFIRGKDVFETFYGRSLARRLLMEKFSNAHAENSMITKLKLECGSNFTAKLEGMLKDIAVSQDMNFLFKQHLIHVPNCSIDMCVNVLTNGIWPNYPVYKVNLPQEMIMYQNIFTKFYIENHSGRKLQWQPNLGHCLISANFNSGQKELLVSVFQAIVILLFNSALQLSYTEIQDALNLETSLLKHTLQSLAHGKVRILLTSSNSESKTINEGDVFVINKDFTDKLFRIKIIQVQLKETIEEQRVTEKTLIQDRQFQIDAAIVRIMKERRTLSHSFLISELYNVLDLPLKTVDLKKRIEILINRDYIKRDKHNSNVYKYIA